MSDTARRARHREVAAPSTRARTVTRRGLHTLVLAVIAGGTVAFAGTTVPDASTAAAPTSASAFGASETGKIDRAGATFVASRLEARAPLTGVSVEIVVDGEARTFDTQAENVGELLLGAGVLVDDDDIVSLHPSTPVVAGMTVEVTTVDTTDEHVTQTDEYETVEEEDDSLPRGERQVETEGVDGVTATTFRVTTTGDEETARELVARAVVSERVDEVVRVGTAEPVVAAPQRSSGTSSSASSGTSSSSAAETSSTPSTTSAPSGGSPKAIAADMVAARGWGSDQFSCLDALWERESNWNPTAQNPSSGAYGIPQSLPGSKMGSVAADWRTNPATQITWGLNYISGRYGTPCAALGHSDSRGWY